MVRHLAWVMRHCWPQPQQWLLCYVHVCVNFPSKGTAFFGVVPAWGELVVGATSSGVQLETLNPSFFKLFLCVYNSCEAIILYWWDCRCMITKTCPLSKCCISLKSIATNSFDFISLIRNSEEWNPAHELVLYLAPNFLLYFLHHSHVTAVIYASVWTLRTDNW